MRLVWLRPRVAQRVPTRLQTQVLRENGTDEDVAAVDLSQEKMFMLDAVRRCLDPVAGFARSLVYADRPTLNLVIPGLKTLASNLEVWAVLAFLV